MGRKKTVREQMLIVPPALRPGAFFKPGTIVLHVPKNNSYGGGQYLTPHYLSRSDAEKIRDELTKALEDEAAVSAVLSHTDMRRPS